MRKRILQLWSRPAIRGISAMAVMRYSTKAFSLLRLAVVAQFLTPADLGSFALSLLVVSVAEVFTETGINIFLLKSPKKLEEYIHTAWGVSLIRGGVIAGVIATLSSFLARFYSDSSLITFFMVAALVPLIRGAINPAIIQYQQNLAFEKESALRIFLQSFDMLMGLILAYVWQSAIGLLYGVILAAALEVILSFMLFTLRPRLSHFRLSLVGSLYKETRVIISNGIVNYLTENLDYFVVGKVLGTAGLGLYQAGYKLASAVTIDLGSLIGQTLYPLYAKLHNEKKPISPLLNKSLFAMATFYVVLALPLLLFTDPLVRFVFRKEEWLAIIPLIRVLFLSGILKSFVASWNPLSILAGNLGHHVIMHIITSILLVAGILIFAPLWGITGAGYAVFLSLLCVQPYAWFVLKQALRRLDP